MDADPQNPISSKGEDPKSPQREFTSQEEHAERLPDDPGIDAVLDNAPDEKSRLRRLVPNRQWGKKLRLKLSKSKQPSEDGRNQSLKSSETGRKIGLASHSGMIRESSKTGSVTHPSVRPSEGTKQSMGTGRTSLPQTSHSEQAETEQSNDAKRNYDSRIAQSSSALDMALLLDKLSKIEKDQSSGTFKR